MPLSPGKIKRTTVGKLRATQAGKIGRTTVGKLRRTAAGVFKRDNPPGRYK